ncbi:MAG: hypothetical protein R3B84_09050 [Zavarzinella sp.]
MDLGKRLFPLVIFLTACSAGTCAEKWYLAVGHGGQRMLSQDGQTWTHHVAWGEPKHDQNDLNVAANFQGTMYAAGGYFSGRITATRDGKTWSEGVIPGSSPIFGLEVVEKTLYAIDLRGKVFKSADGETWKMVAAAEMPTKTHWIRSTSQGNGLIVGSGDYGPVIVFDIAKETIAVHQLAGQVDKNATWKRTAFGNGTFVVGGQAGLLASSTDGIKWKKNETVPERGDIFCVEFHQDRFYATTSKGTVTSKDGTTWEVIEGTPFPRQLRSVNQQLFGYSWPPSKISLFGKDKKWQLIANDRGWQGKAYCFGELSGGNPPALPQPKIKK